MASSVSPMERAGAGTSDTAARGVAPGRGSGVVERGVDFGDRRGFERGAGSRSPCAPEDGVAATVAATGVTAAVVGVTVAATEVTVAVVGVTVAATEAAGVTVSPGVRFHSPTPAAAASAAAAAVAAKTPRRLAPRLL